PALYRAFELSADRFDQALPRWRYFAGSAARHSPDDQRHRGGFEEQRLTPSFPRLPNKTNRGPQLRACATALQEGSGSIDHISNAETEFLNIVPPLCGQPVGGRRCIGSEI